jgi:sugar phosphate isomerase/epimerase
LGGLEIELKRTLTLTFGRFGWTSLAAAAGRERRSLEELISRAAAYLRSELGTSRTALIVPPADGRQPSRSSSIEVALPAAVWQELAEEAARQRVGLGRLLEHAALYYLAALHSGRLAAQVLEFGDGHGRGARSPLEPSGRGPGGGPRRR